ncbi:MAG: twin-arginine translocase TatA/TatE family subunit [Alphaproteobacteria bacterium]|nr:twin-arginine translocase TatA/TatE family subunit [Alphaproteobacteria bacterium]
MTPGPLQIIIIILLIMVLFGASRIPGIMENLAKGVTSFKKGLKDDSEEKKIENKREQTDETS